MEILEGYVKSIVFRNEENGYTVATVVSDGEEVTCVGNLPAIDTGDLIEAEGAFTTHAFYGGQFKAQSVTVREPSGVAEIERYLASGAVRGIGGALAGRIVKAFGDDAFRIIEEEPERLAEVKGISLKKARDIAVSMQEKAGMRSAMIFLQRYGIGGAMAARLLQQYGDEIYTVLRTNPYRLADEVDGIGFQRADEIARKSGISATSEYRLRGGLLYALMQASAEGHCYLPADMLAAETRHLLKEDGADGAQFSDDMVENSLLQLQLEGRIVCVTDADAEPDASLLTARQRVYETYLYTAEQDCAMRLRTLLRTREQARGTDEETVAALIRRAEERDGMELDPLQREAVAGSFRSGVVILTGGPGTGKTTTINTILRLYEENGMEVLCAAPTGRAARRMHEATGREAKTIHRLLEVNGQPEEGLSRRVRFEKNENNPIEADAVIIDEMSMVDIRLFHALLKALSPGTHLILAGDASQLPSVGPGQVLRDLIASGCVPTVVLEKIFRQEEASDIVLNAHRIHRGEHLGQGRKDGDFFLLPRDDVNVVCKHIVELVRDKLPRYLSVDASQIQVLTPMKKGALGAAALNRMLQRYLNPPARGKREHDFGDKTLREGDKVIQVKNNSQAIWEVVGRYNIVTDHGEGVFNGDLGTILEINEHAASVTVEFDEGRRISYPFSQVNELELAYVITIHKSQGSEYPAVVMPLLGGPRPLMNRNLLYTAVTRARSLVVILGSTEVVNGMIDNEEQAQRYTDLANAIRETDRF